MAETLGSLCDKLTIVELKLYHSDNQEKLAKLATQKTQLITEIDEYLINSLNGSIPVEKLRFESNKVYKSEGNETSAIIGSIGSVVGQLAATNCLLWHEQEKVYDFENVPSEEKNLVIKRLATLNLERNACIDTIDSELVKFLISRPMSLR